METKIIEDIMTLSDICIDDSRKICKEEGVSRQESNLLMKIKPGERISCNSISRLIELSPSRVTRIVDSLIDKGYLLREISRSDRRSNEIYLSTGGKKCRKKIIDARALCEERIKRKLNRDELQTINNAFGILLSVLEKKKDAV